MKIIGSTSDQYQNGDFLVQMNHDELANLFGKYWHGEKEYKEPKIGDEFAIGDFYDAISATADSKNQLKLVIEKLDGLTEQMKKLL